LRVGYLLRDGAWLQRTAHAAFGRPVRPYLIAGAAVGAAAAIAALLVAWPPGTAAQVEVGAIAFTLPPHQDRLMATIAIKNDGALPALIIGSTNAFILTPKEMTGREEESEWDHLGDTEEARHDAPRRLEPGAQWPDYAVVKTLVPKEYEAFLSGSSLIYFLMRTVYRDTSLPDTKQRITEACYYYVKDPQRPRLCRGHNRRYVADAPNRVHTTVWSPR
jgi:hypothetical protein